MILDSVGSACNASLAPDELTIYLADGLQPGIRVATRTRRSDPFTPAPPLSAGSDTQNLGLSISTDKLELFFAATERPCGSMPWCFRMHWSSRPTPNSDFLPAARVPVLGDLDGPIDAFLAADGQTLYFGWRKVGESRTHLWRSHRTSTWSAPEQITELVTSDGENNAVVSADNLSLYFIGGPYTNNGVRVATRQSVAQPFGPPSIIDGLKDHAPHWISPDGCRLYVSGDVSGHCGIKVASRPR